MMIYSDGIYSPSPQDSPKPQTMNKKTIIIGVGNPDEWCTQDCPPQDCPPGGNPDIHHPSHPPVNIFDNCFMPFFLSCQSSRIFFPNHELIQIFLLENLNILHRDSTLSKLNSEKLKFFGQMWSLFTRTGRGARAVNRELESVGKL